MTNSNPYRITALIMAFLMFFTSTGFSIDMHFCQGQLKSFSLIGKAKSCHEMAKVAKCHRSKKSCTKTNKSSNQLADIKDCCNNQTLLFKADIDYDKILASEVNFQKQQVSSLAITYNSFNDPLIHRIDYPLLNRPPPLLNKNIFVLIQSFLI